MKMGLSMSVRLRQPLVDASTYSFCYFKHSWLLHQANTFSAEIEKTPVEYCHKERQFLLPVVVFPPRCSFESVVFFVQKHNCRFCRRYISLQNKCPVPIQLFGVRPFQGGNRGSIKVYQLNWIISIKFYSSKNQNQGKNDWKRSHYCLFKSY